MENMDVVLQQLVNRIKGSRERAASIVNTELLTTYWEIGKMLREQKGKEGLDKEITEIFAKDLKAAFPNMKGFSQKNLEYMQTFAAAWPYFPFIQPLVTETGQPMLSLVPWTHHMIILDKANTENERIFYVTKVLANGWTSSMLQVHIETGLYQREGKDITNYETKLPKD